MTLFSIPVDTIPGCMLQIWWFQLKYLTSYRADKVKYTDIKTYRRTDGRRQRQYPFGLTLSEPMLIYCKLDHRKQTSVNPNQNAKIFIQENAFENVVCKIAILSLPNCVQTGSGVEKGGMVVGEENKDIFYPIHYAYCQHLWYRGYPAKRALSAMRKHDR